MDGAMYNTFMIILTVELITGNLGNGFIALVNCVDWVKRRKISSVDGILTALAISRIGVLSTIPICMLVPVFYPGLLLTAKMMKIIILTWTVTNHFNFWLSTSLNIFYFLKIANFSNSIFLYLRWRVKKVVSMMLLVSLILLLLNIVLLHTCISDWKDENERNLSHSVILRNFERFNRLLYLINSVFMFIPFFVSVIAFFLLIISLWKHLKRMQHNATGSRDASTAAHVKVLQTVIVFLLLHTFFLLLRVIQIFKLVLVGHNLIYFIGLVAATGFHSGHSFVLILRTQKLRQACYSVLWWLRCRSQNVEQSGH